MNPTNIVSSLPAPFTPNVLYCNGLRKIYQVIYDIVSYPIKLVAELFGKNTSTPLPPSSLLHQLEPQTNHSRKIIFAACSIATLYLFYSSFFDNPPPPPPPSMLPSPIMLPLAVISVLGLGIYMAKPHFSADKGPSPTLASLAAQIKAMEKNLQSMNAGIVNYTSDYKIFRNEPAEGDYKRYRDSLSALVPNFTNENVIPSLLKVSKQDFNTNPSVYWGFFRSVRAANSALNATAPESSPKDPAQIAIEITDHLKSFPHDLDSVITLVKTYAETKYGRYEFNMDYEKLENIGNAKFPAMDALNGYLSILENFNKRTQSKFLTPIIAHLSNHLDTSTKKLKRKDWQHLYRIGTLIVCEDDEIKTAEDCAELMFGRTPQAETK